MVFLLFQFETFELKKKTPGKRKSIFKGKFVYRIARVRLAFYFQWVFFAYTFGEEFCHKFAIFFMQSVLNIIFRLDLIITFVFNLMQKKREMIYGIKGP